jgi:hypothetical protein
MIHGHDHPLPIDGGSEICVMNKELASEFSLRWKCVNWKMIMADGNRSDLLKVAESVPVDVHGIVISVTIFLSRFTSEQVILVRPWNNTLATVRGTWTMVVTRSYLSHQSVRALDDCRYLSARQEEQIRQPLGTLIRLGNVRATRKDSARHYNGQSLESSRRRAVNEMVSKGRTRKEK